MNFKVILFFLLTFIVYENLIFSQSCDCKTYETLYESIILCDNNRFILKAKNTDIRRLEGVGDDTLSYGYYTKKWNSLLLYSDSSLNTTQFDVKLDYEAKTDNEDFIIYYFQKDPDKGFPLVLYYCDIIPEAGLVILSQTCLFFLQKESDGCSLLRSKLTFLISHVLKNKTFSFLELIQKISSINKN